MTGSASELARRLARDAEAVCRQYLSNGHRAGNHWIVGDVRNTPRPLHACPAEGQRQGSGGQMGRRGDRPNMATCSTSSEKLRPRRVPRRRGRGAALSRHAATEPGPDAAARQRAASRGTRLPRRGASPLRHVAADRRHARPNATCAAAASCLRRANAPCASIPAATTAISRRARR